MLGQWWKQKYVHFLSVIKCVDTFVDFILLSMVGSSSVRDGTIQ